MFTGGPRPLAAVVMGVIVTLMSLVAPGSAEAAEGAFLPGGPISATNPAPV